VESVHLQVGSVSPSLPMHTQKPERLAHDGKIYLVGVGPHGSAFRPNGKSPQPCQPGAKAPKGLPAKDFCHSILGQAH
jgi:hypothetical protein